jgi:hypothetical protein
MNITKATIIKSIRFVKKSPYKTATSPITFPESSAIPSLTIHFKSFKSALNIRPIKGAIIPPVKEVITC